MLRIIFVCVEHSIFPSFLCLLLSSIITFVSIWQFSNYPHLQIDQILLQVKNDQNPPFDFCLPIKLVFCCSPQLNYLIFHLSWMLIQSKSRSSSWHAFHDHFSILPLLATSLLKVTPHLDYFSKTNKIFLRVHDYRLTWFWYSAQQRCIVSVSCSSGADLTLYAWFYVPSIP